MGLTTHLKTNFESYFVSEGGRWQITSNQNIIITDFWWFSHIDAAMSTKHCHLCWGMVLQNIIGHFLPVTNLESVTIIYQMDRHYTGSDIVRSFHWVYKTCLLGWLGQNQGTVRGLQGKILSYNLTIYGKLVIAFSRFCQI